MRGSLRTEGLKIRQGKGYEEIEGWPVQQLLIVSEKWSNYNPSVTFPTVIPTEQIPGFSGVEYSAELAAITQSPPPVP